LRISDCGFRIFFDFGLISVILQKQPPIAQNPQSAI